MKIIRNGSKPSVKGPESFFTGSVRIDSPFQAEGIGRAGGAIVNLSSAASRLGAPGESVPYAASKGAIDSLTFGLAQEVAGEGIRVTAVSPGVIDTEIQPPGRVERVGPNLPMKRAGRAEEVAGAIVYLLSEDASYISGTVLNVSGGR